MGVEAGDEVLVPTLTFVATANAVAYCEATPHFVDSEVGTLGLDAANYQLPERGCRDAEWLVLQWAHGRQNCGRWPMHTFGFPVALDALEEVCCRFSIPMVEDAADPLDRTTKANIRADSDHRALSFNGNKVVTCGGGGAILTNNLKLGALAKHLSTTARQPDRWAIKHDAIGYNYRMPNLNAGSDAHSWEQLPGFLAHKRNLAESYRKALAGVRGVRFVVEPPATRSNYWLNCLVVESGNAEDRNRLLGATQKAGIMTRPAWGLMHETPMYADCPRMDLGVAERLGASLVNLPSSAFLDGHCG